MKKLQIILSVMLIVFGIGLVTNARIPFVEATYYSPSPSPAPCTPYNDYGIRSSDGSDHHANFNFHSNNQDVDITADAGYTITEVWLDLNNVGGGYISYPLEQDHNYNPSGSTSISSAKAHVVKTCPSPSPSVSPSPSPSVSPSPSPSPSPSASPSPSPSPTPLSCEEGYHEVENECVPDESPSPTPSPTPTKGDEPLAPQRAEAPKPPEVLCTITKTVANPLVWRKGNDAIVQWQPTEGNKANVYYKEVKSLSWEHSLRDVENNGYQLISGLGSGDFTFAVQQECGPISPEIVDGDTNGWVLFTP